MALKVTAEDIPLFVEHCQKKAPAFTIRDGKTDSYLMNVIDGLIWPFNPQFMERYITTVVGKVYFPDGMMSRDPLGTLEVGTHEFVHAYDAKRITPLLFGFIYLAPQILVIATLLLFGFLVCWAGFLPFLALLLHLTAVGCSTKLRKVSGFPLLVLGIVAGLALSIYLVKLQSLWLALALIPIAPIPSPGRYWAEMRGYGMSLHFEAWAGLRVRVDSKVRQFVGWAYYKMWPFADSVTSKLEKHAERARAGSVTDPAYLHIWEFIQQLEAKEQGGGHVA